MRIKPLKGNSKRNKPDIESVTANYEAWMRSCTTVLRSDLQSKHEQMKETPFGFLRGTFYRWAQLWPSVCADLCGAPKVLVVGQYYREWYLGSAAFYTVNSIHPCKLQTAVATLLACDQSQPSEIARLRRMVS